MEVSWVQSHHDVMAIHEQLLTAALTAVSEKLGEQLTTTLGITVTPPTTPFPKVTLAEARALVKEDGYEIPRSDGDLDQRQNGDYRPSSKNETVTILFLSPTTTPQLGRSITCVTKTTRPLTNSYDLLYRGVEISTVLNVNTASTS